MKQIYTTKEFTEKIVNKLPREWKDITLKEYLKILEIKTRGSNENLSIRAF